MRGELRFAREMDTPSESPSQVDPTHARSADELRSLVRAGAKPDFLLFWGHRVTRRIGASCLSQWYPAPFELAGVRFATAEHYMMAEKARLFGDRGCEERILAASHPGDAKRMGREVKDFDPSRWEEQRWHIVVSGNLAKFRQNEAFGRYLLGTGQRVLVEASPVDGIWGIGLARDDERATQPVLWQGLNLLGFALMEVRSRLESGAG